MPFLRKLRNQPTNQPNIKVSDFGLIWRPRKYLLNQEFFSKIWLSLFYLYSPLTYAKNQKNPSSCFWENCVTNQPTNQLIITNNNNFIGPRWCRSKKILSWKGDIVATFGISIVKLMFRLKNPNPLDKFFL